MLDTEVETSVRDCTRRMQQISTTDPAARTTGMDKNVQFKQSGTACLSGAENAVKNPKKACPSGAKESNESLLITIRNDPPPPAYPGGAGGAGGSGIAPAYPGGAGASNSSILNSSNYYAVTNLRKNQLSNPNLRGGGVC